VLSGTSVAALGHATEWFDIIPSAYSHRPCYLKGEEPNGGSGILPAFIVRRPFLGAVITSMPFLDIGGPCGGSPSVSASLLDRLVQEAREQSANLVELRCTARIPLSITPMTHKVNLLLPLPNSPEAMWKRLSAKVRNQVRKAERSGLSVRAGGSELLEEFYSVFSINMRDLGSPVHSRDFFSLILDRFSGDARILVVQKDGITLGGLVSLTFKDTMYVPWAASLRRYAHFCPNMLLYWGIIERSIKEGSSRFDFGRSTRGSGTYHFKRQWGAEEVQLYWYSVPIKGRSVAKVSAKESRWALLSQIWRRLPVSVSVMLGPRIRRYLTQ